MSTLAFVPCIHSFLPKLLPILHGCAVKWPDAGHAPVQITTIEERMEATLKTAPEVGRSGPVRRLSGLCIHELFERQVDWTPSATAVVQGDLTLSYRDLNERANRLARHLRHLGVRP